MLLSAESMSMFLGASCHYKLYPVDSCEMFNIGIPAGVGEGSKSGSQQ